MELILKNTHIFSSLNNTELKYVTERCVIKRYKKNRRIWEKDEYGNFLAVIIKGKVKISILAPFGRLWTPAVLSEGDSFGEMALFGDNPRCADAYAIENSELVILHKNDFISCMNSHSSIAVKMVELLADRLRRMNEKFEKHIFFTLKERVADFLTECCEKTKDCKISYTCSDIAEIMGANRESVSRIISEMKSEGILSQEDKIIRVIGIEKLKEISRYEKDQ